MWNCKHCNGNFNFTRTTEKANHSRHCDHNPQKHKSYERVKSAASKRHTYSFGEYKLFSVNCSTCNSSFEVKEREKLHPSKTQYFCNRKCANSIGGKAKVGKYGITQYVTIAEKYYKRQCAVCGITDILDVHHIDEDRSNYHPSNLIYLCPNDHMRYHRNNDSLVSKIIEGHGAAWGGHFTCNEDISGVRIPDAPPHYFKKS